MNNPIVDNRIVSDKTFAIRLVEFIREVQVCDPCSEEEREYLLGVAKWLLEYQKATCTSKEEIDYFKNLED